MLGQARQGESGEIVSCGWHSWLPLKNEVNDRKDKKGWIDYARGLHGL